MNGVVRRTRSPAAAFVLLLTAAAGLVAARPGAAGAASSFTFYGAGWGHGVGMGQYGIYGLAQEGWKYRGMLVYYYEGTSTALVSSPANIRVGLVQDQGSTKLDATNGSVVLRLNDPDTGTLVATIPKGQTWTIEFHADGKFWVKRQTGTYVGGKGWGGTTSDLYANYADQNTIVSVPDTGHEYKRGYFEFNVYTSGGVYRGRLIAVVPTNAYVYGIAEVPASWPMEALKAQATAARTYAVHMALTAGQNRPVCNCAVYASGQDQTYIGYDEESGFDGSRWVQASDDSSWRVVEYGGAVISANYSSSTGGYTESNSAAFGGTQVPYLTAECDPGDYTSINPNRTWQTTLTGAQIGDDIASYTGTDIGDATSFLNTSRSSSGRIVTTTVVGTTRSITLSGTTLQAALGLKSTRFYSNVNMNVTGDIRTKYDDLTCSPGLATSPQTAIGSGLKQEFADGAIYWSSATGAYEVHGLIQQEYDAVGEATGALGFPTSDVVSANGTDTSTFQNGSIACPTSGGTVEDCQVTYT